MIAVMTASSVGTIDPTSKDIRLAAFSSSDFVVRKLCDSGDHVIGIDREETVSVVNTQDGICLSQELYLDDSVWQTAFSPDGTRIAVIGKDRTLTVYDTITGEEIFCSETTLGKFISNFAFSMSGDFLLLFIDESLEIYETTNYTVFDSHSYTDITLSSVIALSMVNDKLVYFSRMSSEFMAIKCFNPFTHVIVWEYPMHRVNFCNTIKFSHDSSKLLIVVSRQNAGVWIVVLDADNGSLISEFVLDRRFRKPVFSLDGSSILVISHDRVVVLDSMTGTVLDEIPVGDPLTSIKPIVDNHDYLLK
jgi:WD40 repeat protein